MDLTSHVPFVNDTVILLYRDYETSMTSLTKENLLKWNTTLEEAEQIARENLEAQTSYEDILLVESKEGPEVAISSQEDGYDSSRLLLPGFHARLSPRLGREFYVSIPIRDQLIAFPMKPLSLVDKIITRAKKDYDNLPYPITPGLFIVTRDGIAGTVSKED